jgi:hypothetical protein
MSKADQVPGLLTKNMSKADQVPGFLTKTYELFGDPANAHCCGWGKNGNSIIITKIDTFSKTVIPKYFKHSNFQSFVRQLNMYDFHKTVQDPSNGEFHHEYFVRGKPELLIHIKRKANKSDLRRLRLPEGVDGRQLTAESDAVLQELMAQKMLRENLEKRIAVLEKRNVHIDEIETMQHIQAGENVMLKRMVTESRQKQAQMQSKMEKVLKCLYHAYLNGGAPTSRTLTNMTDGNTVAKMLPPSTTSTTAVSGMGNFFEVCGFLQLESPMARPGVPPTPLNDNALISPPTTSSTHNSGEVFQFENAADEVTAPLGFAYSTAVPPLMEFPKTPAGNGNNGDSSSSSVSSSGNGRDGSSSSSSTSSSGTHIDHDDKTSDSANVEESANDPSSSSGRGGGQVGSNESVSSTGSSSVGSKKRALEMTNEDAKSLTLDTAACPGKLTYEQFLKKARLQSNTASAKPVLATPAGLLDVPDFGSGMLTPMVNELGNQQSITLERVDSLSSTLDALIELSDVKETPDEPTLAV